MSNLLLTLLAFASATLDIIAVYHWPPVFEYVFKPLTMVFIIMIVIRAKDPDHVYRGAIILGLCCSLAGDVFLMLPWDLFVPGLLSFLVAHLFYIAVFTYTAGRVASLLWAVPFLLYGGVMIWFLLPHVEGFMKLPVMIYIAVILLMGWQALNRFIVTKQGGSLLAAIGAILFIVSDSALAINRFANPFPESSLVVLSTYFAAQWLIAISVAVAGKNSLHREGQIQKPSRRMQEVERRV